MKECLGTVGVMASALRRVKHSFVLRSHSFVTSYVDGIFAPYSPQHAPADPRLSRA